MIIPLYYFLILYCALLLAGIIFVIINIMHLLVFGLESFKTAIVVLCYLGATIAVLWFSYLFIFSYDWQDEIILEDLITSFI